MKQTFRYYFLFIALFLFNQLFSQQLIFKESFDSTITGWSLNNSWAIGVPHGGQGFDNHICKCAIGNPDPITDHTNTNTINKVAGQGLSETSKVQGISGYFNKRDEWIKTPAINCSRYSNIKLRFWRWANTTPNLDKASVEISTDNYNWTNLNQPLYPADTQWTLVEVDISAWANFKPLVYIRWRTVSDKFQFYSGWNIDDVEITATLCTHLTWTGSTSSEWNVATNWNPALVPNNLFNVSIPKTQILPVINCQAICNNLTIDAGTGLTISSLGNLMVNGNLWLKSSILGTAMLLDNSNITVNGSTTIENYIATSGYHFVSSPVISASRNLFESKFYYWNEQNAQNNWNYGWVSYNGELLPTQGYDANLSAGKTISYSNVTNSGSFLVPLTYSDGSETHEHKGWNLIGNPYPSAIDWDLVTIPEELNNAIYIWDPAKRVYTSYVDGIGINGGGSLIAPCQSFFVKVNAPGSTSIELTNNIRKINSSVKFKSSSINKILRLSVKGFGLTDETIVRFNSLSTFDFDEQLDAYKFLSSSSNHQLYTQIGKNLYSINSLTDDYQEKHINLNFKTLNSGNYTLSVSDLTIDSVKVILEDKITNQMIDLKQNLEYTFFSNQTDITERFIIHIYPIQSTTVTNLTSIEDNEELLIYSHQNSIFFKQIKNNTSITIYNQNGQKVYSKIISSDSEIPLDLPSGIYFIETILKNKVASKKIILKN